MDNSKQRYLDLIRANSAYPTYRGFIGLIATIGYLLAAVIAFGAVIGGFVSMSQSFMLGLAIFVAGGVYAALIFLLARFFREASLILVDIGDSVADAISRSQTGQ